MQANEQQNAIAAVFTRAQKSTATHPQCLELLEQLARKSNAKKFAEDFLTLLKPALVVEKASTAHAVDRFIAFVASFTEQSRLSIPVNASKSHELFYLWLVQRILLWHDARSKAVRYRVTQLVALILKNLPDEAEIPSTVWNALEAALLRRAHDKATPVRVEAVRALARLQDPSNENNAVNKTLLRMLQQDPVREVRRLVVEEIATARHTLPFILERLRDTDSSVREAVYRFVEQRLDVKMLKSRHRIQLVREGLRDRDSSVQRAAVALCKQWLANLTASRQRASFALIELVDLLDLGKGEEHIEAAELLVDRLLETQCVTFEPADVAAIEKNVELTLSPSAVLIWRIQAKRVQAKEQWASLDSLLPDVPRFSRLIENAVANGSSATLTQLLELAVFIDVADETARLMLSSLLRGLLPTLQDVDHQVPLILAALRVLHPDVDDCNRLVFEVLSEIMQPIDVSEETITEEVLQAQESQLMEFDSRIDTLRRNGNDPAELEQAILERDQLEQRVQMHADAINLSWLRALRIVEHHLRETTLDLRDPSIAELKSRFVRRALLWAPASAQVRQGALRVLGLYSLRDCDVARSQLKIFIHALSEEEEFVQESVLQILFDLLARFGAALFADSEQQKLLMDQFYVFIDADDVVLRRIVVEGLSKLLYTRQLSDQRVLGIMILMYMNPATQHEDGRLQQLLAQFLPAFAYSHGRNQRLVAQVIPRVMRGWQSAEASTPLSRVPASRLLQFMQDLADPRKLRAYWHDRPQTLQFLEVDDCIHHVLADRLLSDFVLQGSEDASVSLAVLRSLPFLCYTPTFDKDCSLQSLSDTIGRASQIVKKHPKLKLVSGDVEQVAQRIAELVAKALVESSNSGPTIVIAAPTPTSAALIEGYNSSPELRDALIRTARKERVPIDRRAGLVFPQVDFSLELPVDMNGDEGAFVDAHAEVSSTQPESLPENDLVPHSNKKRPRVETASSSTLAKKSRKDDSNEPENEPPQQPSSLKTLAPVKEKLEKRRGRKSKGGRNAVEAED